MQLRNETPFTTVHLAGRLGYPGHSLTLVVKGAFDLHRDAPATPSELQEPPGPDLFAADDPEGLRGPIYESDLVYAKQAADVLFVGRCYAPGGRAVPRCDVGLTVGPMRRKLVVFGDRVWENKLLSRKIGGPEPFREMDLGWDRAFGGEGFDRNPVGRGYFPKGKVPAGVEPRLPNVEDPADLVTAPKSTPAPASFGPVDRTWQPRVDQLGKWGWAWFRERCPWYPQNLDPAVFNAASPEQRVPGFLVGDEPIELANLHREDGRFRARLPGLRVRAFVEQVSLERARYPVPRVGFHEIDMRLDTCWIDGERDRLVLAWRGHFPVSTEEFAEVRDVVVISEPTDAPRADAETFRPKKVAVDAPPPASADGADASAPTPPDAPGPAGRVVDVPAEDPGETIDPPPGAGADDEEIPPALDPHEELAELERRFAAMPPLPPDADPRAVEGRQRFEQAIRELEAAITVVPPPEPEPWTPDSVERAVAEGRSLHGEDLSGLDLTGRELEGGDFRAARLAGTCFEEAKMSGANLSGADLSNARMSRADLGGSSWVAAKATHVELAEARLGGARLDRADLSNAVIRTADLTGVHADEARFAGASFAGSRMDGAELMRSDFAGARFESVTLSGADLKSASLVDADLSGVALDGAELFGVRATGARFEDASLENATALGGADFRRARMARVRASGSVWTEAALDGADLSYAVLEGADLSHASLVEAKLDAARLRTAVLRRVDARRASARDADLFRAILSASDLTEADFRGANLFESDLADAELERARFEGALVGRTRLDPDAEDVV